MHPKRKSSNEKLAQIYTVLSKSMLRFVNRMESIDLSDLLPEHKKDIMSFIKENKEALTRQSNSAIGGAGHALDNLKKEKE